MTFITSETTIEHYKKLKIEIYTYLEGYGKGSVTLQSRVKGFFRHLETLIFGQEIDINDDTFL